MTKISIAAFILSLTAQAQASLGLSPMRLGLPLQPGEVHSGALDLSSAAAAAVRVRGELLDFYIDESMTPQFVRNRPQEAAHSCRGWLIVNPMEAELAPGEHQLVRYTLRVPAGTAPGSYYCAAGFTALPSAEQLRQTGLRATVRVVAVFYAVVGERKAEGEISGLRLERAAGPEERWVAVLTIRNSGGWHFRPQGEVQIQGEGGKVLETLQVPSFPVLPRRQQQFVLPVTQAAPDAIRRLKAEVDIGAGELQEAAIDVPARTAAY